MMTSTTITTTTNEKQEKPLEPKPLVKIWIVTTGSRGDVQPYCAVALALQKKGYEVHFYTTETHVGLPQGLGISTTVVAPDIQQILGETVEENPFMRGMATANTNDLMEGLKLLTKKSAPFTRDVIRKAIKEDSLPDLCIANILSLGVAWYLALKYEVPFYELGCSDSTFHPEYAGSGLPVPPFKLHYYFLKYLIPMFRMDVNLPTLEALADDEPDDSLVSILAKKAPRENTLDPILARGVMISPEIAKVLHPQASPKLSFLGCTVLPDSHEMKQIDAFGGTETFEKIQKFLDATSDYDGKKIVYIGWGSMLFSVIVHHGGAGTTTAAMRAGIPMIITPLITDQHDYAFTINKLGNGKGMQLMHKLTWEELGDCIHQVANDAEMTRRAAEIGAITKAEDGASNAVAAVELYWREVGKTPGKFRELWPGTKPPSFWARMCGN